MSYTPEDTLEILRKLRMDLTNAQGKLTDAMNAVAQFASQLPASDSSYTCPKCGIPKSNAEAMADHLANVHGEERRAVA